MRKGLSAGREEWLAAPSANLVRSPLHIAPVPLQRAAVRVKDGVPVFAFPPFPQFEIQTLHFALTSLPFAHFAAARYLVWIPRARAIK